MAMRKRSVEQEWAEFSAMLTKAEVPAVAFDLAKKAFYMGVTAVVTQLLRVVGDNYDIESGAVALHDFMDETHGALARFNIELSGPDANKLEDW